MTTYGFDRCNFGILNALETFAMTYGLRRSEHDDASQNYSWVRTRCPEEHVSWMYMRFEPLHTCPFSFSTDRDEIGALEDVVLVRILIDICDPTEVYDTSRLNWILGDPKEKHVVPISMFDK